MPQECLILTMKTNQKYFPLLDAHGKLHQPLPDRVSNIATARSAARSIGGNERVVRPRLADAQVLLRPGPQEAARDRACRGSRKVVYHNKLGTQGERIERVRAHRAARSRAQLGADALARRPTAPRCWPRPTC